jgi:hypothetical protein
VIDERQRALVHIDFRFSLTPALSHFNALQLFDTTRRQQQQQQKKKGIPEGGSETNDVKGNNSFSLDFIMRNPFFNFRSALTSELENEGESGGGRGKESRGSTSSESTLSLLLDAIQLSKKR